MGTKLDLAPLEACPACRSKQSKKLFDIEGSTLFRCLNCGLKFINPCLTTASMSDAYQSEETLSSLHDFHKGYYEYGDLNRPSKTFQEFSKALDMIEGADLSGKSKKIFDVGSGNGFFLAIAQSRGWQVDGIDSSSDNAKIAENKFSVRTRVGDFGTFEALENQFDVISFWDVIEHLPDPDQALQKASKMLRPGGLILVGVPNDASLLALTAQFLHTMSFGLLKLGTRSLYFLEHVSYYNLSTLKVLFNRNGWRLKNNFYSSTDLNKYSLPFLKNLLAGLLLTMGKAVGLQNRLVACFHKS